jgi:hypothetical protein
VIRRGLLLALLVPVAFLASGCGGAPRDRRPGRELPPSPPASPSGDPGSTVPPEPDATAPLSRESVRLYFPSASDEGLIEEPREILRTTTPGDRAKQILSDLLSGPSSEAAVSFIPTGTRLRQVYVVDQTAYADFSEELRAGLDGGSDPEILTVYSIVNSLVLNIHEIARVGILVEGRPCETLNGHLDLRRPLKPNQKLIFGAEPAGEAEPGKTVVESAHPPRAGA